MIARMVYFAGPAELEKLTIVSKAACLCMQQGLLFHAAVRIGYFDQHLGVTDPLMALLVVERDSGGTPAPRAQWPPNGKFHGHIDRQLLAEVV